MRASIKNNKPSKENDLKEVILIEKAKVQNDSELVKLSSSVSPLIPKIQEATILTTQEKLGVFLLHTLYFVQGIPLGFFGLAVSILLTETGADFNELAILSFCIYPFCFKILIAPIMDTYFFEEFGKRKSYVIPCQYLLALCFFILSFTIDKMIIEKNVGTLTVIGFLMVSGAAIQDIAVDGWNLTLLENENLGWGSVAQGVGQSIGVLLGGNVLIMLSSTKFCNEYFYDEPRENPFLSLNACFKIFSIIILLINLWVHFLIKERNPITNNEYPNIWALIKEFKGFYFNKNLRFLIFFFLTWKFGTFTIIATFSFKMIQEGFPKEKISTISTFLIPLNFLISFLVGEYVRSGREMTNYFRYCLITFFNNFFLYFLILIYGSISNGLFIFLIIIGIIIKEGCITAIFVNQGAFQNRISDEDVGATYLTFLNSVSNFGKMGSTSIVLFLMNIFDFNVLVFFGFIYTLVYFLLFYKTIIGLEKIEKKDWKL